MPHTVFRAAAIGRMGGNSLSLDLPENATGLVRTGWLLLALAGWLRFKPAQCVCWCNASERDPAGGARTCTPLAWSPRLPSAPHPATHPPHHATHHARWRPWPAAYATQPWLATSCAPGRMQTQLRRGQASRGGGTPSLPWDPRWEQCQGAGCTGGTGRLLGLRWPACRLLMSMGGAPQHGAGARMQHAHPPTPAALQVPLQVPLTSAPDICPLPHHSPALAFTGGGLRLCVPRQPASAGRRRLQQRGSRRFSSRFELPSVAAGRPCGAVSPGGRR